MDCVYLPFKGSTVVCLFCFRTLTTAYRCFSGTLDVLILSLKPPALVCSL